MSTIYKRWLSDKRLWMILAAVVVRMGFYGFRYYPLLDDYIQYGSYPLVEQPFRQVYLQIGLYATRPLAGLVDLYIWGRLWNHMGVALVIITLLHGASAYLFLKTAGKLKLPLGLAFAVIFLLWPINFEATYWISASSRLVVPVFFAALALYYQAAGKRWRFWLFQLISLLFYEQAAVCSLLLSALVAWRQRDKKSFAIAVGNGTLLLGYYLVFARMGSFGSRAALQFFNVDAMRNALLSWDPSWYGRGLLHGLQAGGIWYGVGALLLSLCFVFEPKTKASKQVFFAGLGVFFLSYLPLFVLENTVVALRNTFVPLIGIAMMADSLLSLFPGKSLITACLALFCLLVAPGELYDYRLNCQIDRQVMEAIAQQTAFGIPNVIQGGRERNIRSNFDFAQHISGIASSDWAVTGGMRAYFGQPALPYYCMEPPPGQPFHVISIPDFSFAPNCDTM